MNPATPAIQDLARRLIAYETARSTPDGAADETTRVCDKLRGPLAKLAGVDGFRTLLARALALATAKALWLEQVKVGANGSLEGFDAASRQQDAAQGIDGGVAVVADLLGLLVTFIGEPLTLRLVRDAWPDSAIGESNPQAEGRS